MQKPLLVLYSHALVHQKIPLVLLPDIVAAYCSVLGKYLRAIETKPKQTTFTMGLKASLQIAV